MSDNSEGLQNQLTIKSKHNQDELFVSNSKIDLDTKPPVLAKNRSKSFREERDKKENLQKNDIELEQKLKKKKEKEDAKNLRKEMKQTKKIIDYDDLQLQCNLPLEGKLIVLYASNLILNRQYLLAIKVLEKFGYYYKNEEDNTLEIINSANIKKLLAIAYYYQEINFSLVDSILTEVREKFKSKKVSHGVATCYYAKAFFMFHKSTEFINELRKNEDIVLENALEDCQRALLFYEKLKHL